jgi:hypothetical protein
MSAPNDELRARYPLVHELVSKLPDGFDSYPEFVSKFSVLRARFMRRPTAVDPALLPRPVADLFVAPPASSAWVPSVTVQTAALAFADTHFGGPGGETRYLALVRSDNERNLSSPLYRALFALISPEGLSRRLSERWNAFHRGPTLTAVERTPRSVTLALEYPRSFYHPLTLRGLAVAFDVAVIAAGGKATTAIHQEESETRTTYRIRWS